ncbi:MAG: hypothetical protein GX660_19785 [Clostridiaceae bacterium]|nr:hypothetical protein [Clostridiaceae bacterium]
MSILSINYFSISGIAEIQPIILLAVFTVFVLSRVTNNYVSSIKRGFNKTCFSFDTIKEKIHDMMHYIESDIIEIGFGKFYRFERLNNRIVFVKKERYSLMEAFVCFHEAGHCIDAHDKYAKKVYKLYEFISIFRFLLIFASLVCVLMFLIIPEIRTIKLGVIVALAIIAIIAKIITTLFVELRASRIALNYMKEKKIIESKTKNSIIIRFMSITAILDQICIEVMFLSGMISVFYVFTSIK